MADRYFVSQFDGYSNSTAILLTYFGNATLKSLDYSGKVELGFACFGILVNLFHIFILTRKSMRTGSINMLLLAIGIGDLLNMSVYSFNEVLEMIQDPDCYWPSSYWLEFFNTAKRCVYDVFRRLNVWLAVLMALVRFLVIRNAMNATFQKLSETFFGLISILISLMLSSGVSSIYFYHVSIKKGDWFPAEKCLSQLQIPANVSLTRYYPSIDNKFLESRGFGIRTFVLIDGGFKMFLSIALPVFTFLLIMQLQIAKRNRRKLSAKDEKLKPDHTTKMITLMTAASVIAEGPFGIMWAVEGVADQGGGVYWLSTDLNAFWAVFVAVNSSTHCFISLVMSTQYKKAVEDSFSFLMLDKRRKSVVSVAPRSSVGAGSMASAAEVRARRRSEY